MSGSSGIDLVVGQLDLLKNNLRDFVLILTNAKRFIQKIDANAPEQIIGASVFASLMSLLSLAIVLPVYRLNHVQTPESYVIIDTAVTYIGFLINGTIFHLIAKLFWGKGSLNASIVTYLYLTAFQPVMGVLLLPVAVHVIGGMISTSGGFAELLSFTHEQLLQSPVALISELLASTVLVWWWVSLARTFRVVHGFGAFRAVVVAVVAFVCVSAFMETVGLGVDQVLWKAYVSQ